MKRKTTWAVSAGECSDYQVLCVCDSEKRAEVVVGLLKDGPDGWHREARVEELPMVDYEPSQVTIYGMSCEVWDAGTTSEARQREGREWPFLGDDAVPVTWRWVRAPIHAGKGGRLEVSGTSHRLVARVFSEKRARLLMDPAFRATKESKGRTA